MRVDLLAFKAKAVNGSTLKPTKFSLYPPGKVLPIWKQGSHSIRLVMEIKFSKRTELFSPGGGTGGGGW